MMNYQTEAKPQCWRAVAVFDDRPDMLLYLNRSSPQVRAGYREAFMDLLEAYDLLRFSEQLQARLLASHEALGARRGLKHEKEWF